MGGCLRGSFVRQATPFYGADVPISPQPRRRAPFVLALILATIGSSAAVAQSASTPSQARSAAAGDTVRLTDEEREAVLNKTTVESAEAARGEMTGPDRAKLEVHGEVSAFIGSHDSRGVSGTAAVPLGEKAGAVVSFETEQFGYRR